MAILLGKLNPLRRSDWFKSRFVTGLAIFLGYFLFAMMSAYGYNANESYVTLLGNWGMLIMGAYFGGRTIEKLADMKGKK